MNILIPVFGFGRAGGYRVLSQLANYWIANGHTVEFICPADSNEPYFPTVANILRVNAFGRLLRNKSQKSAGQNSLRTQRNLLGIYLGLCSMGHKYDVVLANHSLTAWPVALARCGSAKKFYYIQAYEPEYYELEAGWRSNFLGWFSKTSYKFPIKQVCNAPVYIGYKGIKAEEWVPPGIDPNIFFKKESHKDLQNSDQIIIGCIGRSEPGKGIRYVLEAFEQLWAMDHRFRLRVAYGNLPKDWTHPALEIVVPRNDCELGEYYRSLDIMVAPGTIQLGAPHYPVIEAMACAVPVVTTGYMPATDKNSWIVPVGDSQAIRCAVLKIVDCSLADLESFVFSGVAAVEKFGWKYVSQRLLNVFERA